MQHKQFYDISYQSLDVMEMSQIISNSPFDALILQQ